MNEYDGFRTAFEEEYTTKLSVAAGGWAVVVLVLQRGVMTVTLGLMLVLLKQSVGVSVAAGEWCYHGCCHLVHYQYQTLSGWVGLACQRRSACGCSGAAGTKGCNCWRAVVNAV